MYGTSYSSRDGEKGFIFQPLFWWSYLVCLCVRAWTGNLSVFSWHDIQRPFMCWFSHVHRRWGHVSLALLGHRVQLGFGWVRGRKSYLGS